MLKKSLKILFLTSILVAPISQTVSCGGTIYNSPPHFEFRNKNYFIDIYGDPNDETNILKFIEQNYSYDSVYENHIYFENLEGKKVDSTIKYAIGLEKDEESQDPWKTVYHFIIYENRDNVLTKGHGTAEGGFVLSHHLQVESFEELFKDKNFSFSQPSIYNKFQAEVISMINETISKDYPYLDYTFTEEEIHVFNFFDEYNRIYFSNGSSSHRQATQFKVQQLSTTNESLIYSSQTTKNFNELGMFDIANINLENSDRKVIDLKEEETLFDLTDNIEKVYELLYKIVDEETSYRSLFDWTIDINQLEWWDISNEQSVKLNNETDFEKVKTDRTLGLKLTIDKEESEQNNWGIYGEYIFEINIL